MSGLRGSKFEPLTNYLKNRNSDAVTLSFGRIEDILGFRLAPSARKYTAYWHPADTHTFPRSWAEAGYELCNLDIKAERATLRRKRF